MCFWLSLIGCGFFFSIRLHFENLWPLWSNTHAASLIVHLCSNECGLICPCNLMPCFYTKIELDRQWYEDMKSCRQRVLCWGQHDWKDVCGRKKCQDFRLSTVCLMKWKSLNSLWPVPDIWARAPKKSDFSLHWPCISMVRWPVRPGPFTIREQCGDFTSFLIVCGLLFITYTHTHTHSV